MFPVKIFDGKGNLKREISVDELKKDWEKRNGLKPSKSKKSSKKKTTLSQIDTADDADSIHGTNGAGYLRNFKEA